MKPLPAKLDVVYENFRVSLPDREIRFWTPHYRMTKAEVQARYPGAKVEVIA